MVTTELSIVEALKRSAYFTSKLADYKIIRKIEFSGLIGASKSALAAALAEMTNNLLVIVASTGLAEKVRSEIELLSAKPVRFFPALDVLPEDDLSPSQELVGQRLATLNGWLGGERQIVVAPLKAVLQKTTRLAKGARIATGDQVVLQDLIARLVDFGYKRFDIVGERGEFSVRGGVIDIFPPDLAAPVRLELLEDRVESLRSFDSFSQRSTGKISELILLPAEEKSEASIFEFIPTDTIVALYEPLDIRRVSPDKLPRENIELSTFLSPGDTDGGAVLNELGFSAVWESLEKIVQKVKPIREGVAEELLADLKLGDHVVHENYGIGIFRGLQSLEVEGIKQEYLLIEYAAGDKLYVPPPMIGLVEKYSSGSETAPRLSRLGTRAWLKTRDKVKQSLRDLTQELLVLYAAREKQEGFAFPADDIWQRELEATFPYDATPDQIKAINDVKADMASGRPMDRLVCGDVGYGKTEVAIRAAAKAASAGKQVALLAPTTILVEQHYNNFKARFKNTPFVIEMLSRFRSPQENKETIKLLAAGGADIVIGTHRLLSKDVKFSDLGLLIIDEEQKFGVAHKEKIKGIKKTVDVLTLSATPIPRTLYFSLTGVRPMSQISTPPVDRSPIRTYVVPYSDKITREAILRELDRGGQVYFLHNYVETIEGVASKLAKLIPEARIAVGHGQMDEQELEKTMFDFLEKKYDVLVCTSIIESGLDITNVNTILIDQADRLGLSQLYQIRGRVGRSPARAYAYLFYHPARSMSDQAVERLKAIQEFTALGSGYKLAMRDLEIRGAGNLLGAEQSGHVYEVGFDLYCELLEEAVKESKGENVVKPREVDIDLNVEASVPSSYVTDERQRIALYRRMNLITTNDGVEDVRKELADRFGQSPPQVETLLRVVALKVRSLESGVRSIKEKDGKIRIEWISKKVQEFAFGKEDKIKLAMLNIAG